MDKQLKKGTVASELIIVAMEMKGKRPTQLNFKEMIDVVEAVVKNCNIADVSYCAKQTKNALTNKFCNIAKKHVGKTFDEVPEATELLKAIDVIEKHCS